tara:strand:- start:4341 stop:4550 length:210 start_codon:yes stop_codon:yes gene_type:complete
MRILNQTEIVSSPTPLSAIFMDPEKMQEYGGCVTGPARPGRTFMFGGEPDPDDDGTGPDSDDYGEESDP